MELIFPFAWEREPSFFWVVVYLLMQFLLQNFQQPYSRNPVYLLEHKRLFYIFRYYAPYRGCHGNEENQNNQHKVQIPHLNNKASHRMRNRRPNLENRWLLMVSDLGFEILCQCIGELLSCTNTVLYRELCGQKNIASCRNVR